jgi:hypothetical protein
LLKRSAIAITDKARKPAGQGKMPPKLRLYGQRAQGVLRGWRNPGLENIQNHLH